MSNDEILKIALSSVEENSFKNVMNSTKFKVIGSTNVDLYFYVTNNSAIKTIIENVLQIKNVFFKSEKKTIRDIYINDKKYEWNIVKLSENKDIKILKLDSLKRNDNFFHNDLNNSKNLNEKFEQEKSGNMFEFETSIFERKKFTILFYNKNFNKEFSYEVKTSSIQKEKSSKYKDLRHKINVLLKLEYEPKNAEAKELMDFFDF